MMNPLNLPLSEPGSPMDRMAQLAPGVFGYAMADGETKRVNVPWIAAEKEGNGDVGRFLSELEKHPDAYAIPNVISRRFHRILILRNWRCTILRTPDGEIDYWLPPERGDSR